MTDRLHAAMPMTKEEMIAGLKAGRRLMVDRRHAPELIDLWELHRQGLVDCKLIEFDEQSSALRWWWCGQKEAE